MNKIFTKNRLRFYEIKGAKNAKHRKNKTRYC